MGILNIFATRNYYCSSRLNLAYAKKKSKKIKKKRKKTYKRSERTRNICVDFPSFCISVYRYTVDVLI